MMDLKSQFFSPWWVLKSHYENSSLTIFWQIEFVRGNESLEFGLNKSIRNLWLSRDTFWAFASLECSFLEPLATYVTWYLSNQHFVSIWQLKHERHEACELHKKANDLKFSTIDFCWVAINGTISLGLNWFSMFLVFRLLKWTAMEINRALSFVFFALVCGIWCSTSLEVELKGKIWRNLFLSEAKLMFNRFPEFKIKLGSDQEW